MWPGLGKQNLNCMSHGQEAHGLSNLGCRGQRECALFVGDTPTGTGGASRLPGSKFENRLNLFPRHMKLLDELLDVRAGLEVFEDGCKRHPRALEDPRTAASAGNALNGRIPFFEWDTASSMVAKRIRAVTPTVLSPFLSTRRSTWASPAPIQLRGVVADFRSSLVHKWSVAIQHQLKGGNALDVSYVGNHQAHQFLQPDFNACLNSPLVTSCDSLRRYPNISSVRGTAASSVPRRSTLPTRHSGGTPDNNLQNTTFGKITSTQTGSERRLQLAMRVTF